MGSRVWLLTKRLVVQAQPGDGSLCFDPQKVIINDILRYSFPLKDSSRYSCASDTIIFVKRTRDRGKRGKTYFTVIVPITKSFNGFLLNVPTDFKLLWKALLTLFAQRSSLVIGPRVVQFRSSSNRRCASCSSDFQITCTVTL